MHAHTHLREHPVLHHHVSEENTSAKSFPTPFCDYNVIRHWRIRKQFSEAVIIRLATEGGSQSTDSFTTLIPLEMFHEMRLLRKQESNTS